MSHADKVRESEQAVVKAAVGLQAWMRTFGMTIFPREYQPEHHREVVSEYESLRAATCPKCGGTGKHPRKGKMWTDGDLLRFDGPPCPAKCDDGRAK